MKTLVCFLLLIISGCCNPPKCEQCADRPIYQPYTIELPVRPKLIIAPNTANEGVIVRSIEQNMSSLAEYAEKLENLLFSLPKTLSVPQ